MLNSPIQHGIEPVSEAMPCVKSEEEIAEIAPYETTRYVSTEDFRVENPYNGPYVTKHELLCEDFKMESPYDEVYGDCNGTNYLSSYADKLFSDDDSSRDSEDTEGALEPEDKGRRSALRDTDSDSSSESSSSGSSSSSSSTSDNAYAPAVTQRMCETCGMGPYKNIKVHLLHCSGVASPFQCSVCKKGFRSEKAQLKHRARYHVCFLCSEVFVHWSLYRSHVCPKGPKPLSPTIFWSCSTSPPNKCNICKAFFATRSSLLSHMVLVHSTKVTSKVCIITNPALVTPVHTASSRLVLVSGGISSSQDVQGLAPALNGHRLKSQGAALRNGDRPNILGTCTHTQPHKSKAKPQTPVWTEVKHNLNTRSRAAAVAAVKATSAASPPASWTAAAVVCKAMAMAAHPPIVLRISKTKSRDQPAARSTPNISSRSRRRRSKALYTCRQCGAVSRQPSHAVSHRYRHRGCRPHRCQCGRAFLHRLHLLRHCVQHAEATSYICAKCGETFRGAKLLVEHLTGRLRKPLPGASSWTLKSRKNCIKKVPFCSVGLFVSYQQVGLFRVLTSQVGLFVSNQQVGLVSVSNQQVGLFVSNQQVGLFVSNQQVGLFVFDQQVGLFVFDHQVGLFHV
ncbi:hypothetical protein CRUP_003657 [Coryphaenoides rupestris]|nr:hypothetical protein CRUP_003657 [Coryphaenoides rupestris]